MLLTGIGGATSFGQAAFVGIAAYASAWLTTAHGVSPWLGLLFALALTGIAALAIGVADAAPRRPLPAAQHDRLGPLDRAPVRQRRRVRPAHRASPTCRRCSIGGWSLVEPRAIYYLIWALVGLAFVFNRNLLQSRPGRAIRSLRGGAVLLASVGADAFRVRLDAVRSRRAARRPRRLALRAHEPLRQPVAVRRPREHRVFADGGRRRPRPAERRARRRRGRAAAEERPPGHAAAPDAARRPAPGGRVRGDLHPAAAARARRPDGLRAALDARPLRRARGRRRELRRRRAAAAANAAGGGRADPRGAAARSSASAAWSRSTTSASRSAPARSSA